MAPIAWVKLILPIAMETLRQKGKKPDLVLERFVRYFSSLIKRGAE